MFGIGGYTNCPCSTAHVHIRLLTSVWLLSEENVPFDSKCPADPLNTAEKYEQTEMQNPAMVGKCKFIREKHHGVSEKNQCLMVFLEMADGLSGHNVSYDTC